MRVTKRNGKKEEFNEKKILKCVQRACKGISEVDHQTVVYNAVIKLYDGVTTEEIDKSLIKSARALIEQEPNYRFVAARLLLTTVTKEVFGEGVDTDAYDLQYKKTFIINLKKLISKGIVNPELAEFNLNKLSKHLNPERDLLFEYLGLQTVADRYLHHIDGKLVETPQAWLMRVAMGLALKEENKEEWAIKFYDKLSSFEYMASTPTLFNSGNVRNQLSSCFLSTFEDSIEGIFDGLHQEAQKSKFAGGLGMDLTALRAGNAYIRGTNGYTQGAVYFWKLFNDMLVAVNQGGKRKGAGCAYLESWHSDIHDFLELRKNVGEERKRTHDMNTANWIPDLFMKQIKNEGKWYLMSPHETPELHDLWGDAFEKKYWEYVEKGKAGELKHFQELEAKDLWKKMLKMLFETGHPWVTFKDPSNLRYSNQHEGIVHSSNLCTEILLHTKPTKFEPNNDRKIKEYGETAVCNLGSINLSRHVKLDEKTKKYVIDWDKLAETISIGSRMLDNVIDINFYPTQEAKISNNKHRPVGMGSMGWHDMFYSLDMIYDSDEAVNLSGKLYEFISYHTILNSSKLAKERGTYKTYKGSLWSKNVLPVDTYVQLMKFRGVDVGDITRYESLDWSVVREHIKKYGMRNSNTMAIAPTATISSITGCSSCTEPYYNIIFVYSTLSGDFTMVNDHFVAEMKTLGLWNAAFLNKLKSVDGDLSRINEPKITDRIKLKYKNAFQQSQLKIIDAAAERGRWIDQGMSLNLFNDKTSLKYLNDIYFHAWEKGLKTTYYLRNKGASQIEKASVVSKSVEKIISSIGDDEEASAEPIAACRIDNPNCESCQ
jgi:ribonucleoside-diphosphate reductase alpha chain